MSLLNEVTTGIQIPAIKINVSGTDGIGKTTFASQAPKPIFIKTEAGTNYVDTSSFPLCESYDDIVNQIRTLHDEKHDYKTVVFDTTDWAEKLVQQTVCMNHSIKSIESLGYGKGFTESAELFGRLLRMFDALQKKKMHVILLSHVGIRTFNDPEREPYDRWEMSTHKKVSAMIREWVDFNLFANYEVSTRTSGQGFKETTRAVSYGKRKLFHKYTAAFDAKSRVDLGVAPLDLDWTAFMSAFKQSLKSKQGEKNV
jgi:hypothetical protein